MVKPGNRRARAATWEGSFEALEPRMLLSDGAFGGQGMETIQWWGGPVDVVRNSWLLTFSGRGTEAQAIARATQAAAALGVSIDRIDSIARGRYARLITSGAVTEGAASNAVAQLGFLEQVEPERVYYRALAPNDPFFGQQWAHLNIGQTIPGAAGSGAGLPGADIRSTDAWDRQTGSRQVIIAVLDSGIDLLHPDLRDNIWTNPGEVGNNNADDDGNGFVDDVNGWDFSGVGDNLPQDQLGDGHGTAVSGIIGAVGNNGIGVAGIAWEVSLLPLKIFGDNEPGAALGAILGAIDYCTMMLTDYGHNIVASNNSYGALAPDLFGFFNTAEAIAIQEFTDAGGLFVAAAGNDTNDNDGSTQAFPASYPNPFIISVAATDNLDQLADFSNYGATTVHLGAPGARTLTTAVGGGYTYIDGTSFAAPYTAGVIALLAAESPFASQTQLRDAILNSVDPIPALQGRTTTGGRLNADRALRLIEVPGPKVTAVFPGSVSGPVNHIIVGFSEPINEEFFNVSGITLRRTNGDGLFNANDVFITIPSSAVTFNGAVMRISLGANLPVDLFRLTLDHQFFRDFEGNFLNGDAAGGNDEVYTFRIVAGGGPLEPNDSLQQATPVILDGAGRASFSGLTIGDGPHPTRDVDLFRVTLPGPGLITAEVFARNLPIPSTLDSVLRLFDGSGRELTRNDNFNGLDSRVQFFVGSGGSYYIGVSGFGNSGYNPGLVASGTPGGSTGVYDIAFHVDSAASETITYASSGGPLPIPAVGTMTSTILVPDVRRIQDLNVRVNILHGYVGDLQIRLTSPWGQTVPLALNRGGAGQNYSNTLFDDQAATPINASLPPFAGTFRPEGQLSVYDDRSAEGPWTLTITDTAPLNSGTLVGWALIMRLENSISGPFEFNDTLVTAADTLVSGTGAATLAARIGDGAYGRRDVDLYRFTADAGTTVTVSVTVSPTGPNAAPNLLDSVLRLFDGQGNELMVDARPDSQNSSLTFPVQFAGTYFIGVSGGPNADYSPTAGGSGVPAGATGDYTVSLLVLGGITEQALVLAGNQVAVGVAQDGTLGGGATGVNRSGVEFVAAAGAGATPESFYGATYNDFMFRNAGPGTQIDLPVSLATQSDFKNRRVLIEGLFRPAVPQPDPTGGLLVRRSLSFGEDDRYIAVDVSLTNTTFLSMQRVGWVEGLRPMQAVTAGSSFSRTVNNVDNQTGRLATATYSNVDFPGGLTIALAAVAPGGEASAAASVMAPGTVRDALQVIANPVDPDPSGSDFGAEGDGVLTVAYDLGVLPAGATVNVRYFIFTGLSRAEVQDMFAELETGDGTGHLVADPLEAGIAAADLPYAVYYPEGYANFRASTFLPLNNPHHVPARVVVIARYENPSLAPTVLFDGTVGASSRGGVTITTPELYASDELLVHKDTPYALEILSSLPIGATLSHYDFGISTGQAFTSQPSTTWTFSEGFKGQNVNDFLVFYNTTGQTIKVTLTIMPEPRPGVPTPLIPPMTQEVGPNRRGGWDLASTGLIPDGTLFGMRLDAEAPVVAALTHFDNNFRAGFAVLGVPSVGAMRGVSPEGQLGVNSSTEYVTVLNAGTQPSEITFTFMFANQSAFRQRLTVPAGQRGGFSVGDLPGFPKVNQPYSVTYEASRPVSVTLASFSFGAATATRFANDAHTYWLFSEGFRPGQGEAVTEYLRLFQNTSGPVTVEISIDFAPAPAFGDPGGTETFRRVLTPRAANDFDIHEFVTGERAGRDTFYSVSVRAPVPITAYTGRFDAFLNGGFGTLGTPLGVVQPSI